MDHAVNQLLQCGLKRTRILNASIKKSFRRFFRAHDLPHKIKRLCRLGVAMNTHLHAFFPEFPIFGRLNVPESQPNRKTMGQLKNLNRLIKTFSFVVQYLSNSKSVKNGPKTGKTNGENASNRPKRNAEGTGELENRTTGEPENRRTGQLANRGRVATVAPVEVPASMAAPMNDQGVRAWTRS